MARGSREISAAGKKNARDRSNEANARAARLISRTGSSAKLEGDGLSEAAAAQSSKAKQPQAGTATEQ